MIIYLVIWAATMVAGYFVGAHKGRAGAGVLWTFCLGLIGLIVVLTPAFRDHAALEAVYHDRQVRRDERKAARS